MAVRKFLPLLFGAPWLLGCPMHEPRLLMAADPQALQIAQDPPPPPPPPPPEPPPRPKRWYGWQLIAAYAPIDFALVWGAYFALQKELDTAIPFMFMGFGGHLAAGGFIHKFHDEERKGQGSILLQAGVMTTGFAVGLLATPKKEAERTKMPSTATMLAGSIGGAVVAGAIDAGIMSWEPIYGSSAKRNVEWVVLPLPVGDKGLGVGVGGRF